MKVFHFVLSLGLVLTAGLFAGCSDNAPPAGVQSSTVVESQPAESEAGAPAVAGAQPETPAVKETAPAASSAAKTFNIVPNDDSSLSFTGYKIIGPRVGGFPEFSGTIVLADGTIESGTIELEIDTSKLYADATALTGVLRGESFFNVEAFPTAKFTASSLKKTDTGYTVTATLQIRDVTKPLQFDASIEESGDSLLLLAEFTIDRSQWGIGADSWEGTLIKNDVLISFEILAELAGS